MKKTYHVQIVFFDSSHFEINTTNMDKKSFRWDIHNGNSTLKQHLIVQLYKSPILLI